MERERIPDTIKAVFEEWSARQAELLAALKKAASLMEEQARDTESDPVSAFIKLKAVPEDMGKIAAGLKANIEALEMLARAQGADNIADALRQANDAMQALQQAEQK